MKFWIFGTLMALTVFTSCKKDNDDEQPKFGCQLTKVTQGLNPDRDTIFMFKYRADGLPDSISREFENGDTWLSIVYKPGTTLLHKVWLDLPGADDFVMSEFEYNEQGKVTKASTFLGQVYTYHYNTGGQLTRVDVTRWGNPETYYYSTVMDSNGSLTEVKRISTEDGRVWENFTIEYTDIENAIGGANTLNLGNDRGMNYLFPGSEFFPFPSKYLVKKRIVRNQSNEVYLTADYVYEKDAKNNVTKAVVSFPDTFLGGTKYLTWKFDYECQ